MKYLVLCVTLNYLFFINQVHSLSLETSKPIDFQLKSRITLWCNVTEDKNESSGSEVKWQKDGTLLTELDNLKGRFKTENSSNHFILKINNAQEKDAGNYTCMVGNVKADIPVASKMAVKVASNVNVIEGEKLRLHCLTIGTPPPQLHWEFKNDTYNETFYTSTDRVTLEDDDEKKTPNAIFIINTIEMYDRGEYTCIGTSPITGESEKSTSMVRIKDKYAALWPFLGICAEVIVLCAIIFIYEKKRNKTELEESDTDQSPDQKNTPDHGKDTNLRHRQ